MSKAIAQITASPIALALQAFVKVAADQPITYKESTSRQIVAPNETLRNMLSIACADTGVDYSHVIGVCRSIVAGESTTGQSESMTDAEIEAEYTKADTAYTRLEKARKVYKATGELPDGLTPLDFMEIDELKSELHRLKVLRTRRATEKAKAAKAAKEGEAKAATPEPSF